MKSAAPAKKLATTKKGKAEPVRSSERRTSGRQRTEVKYVETGDSTDDEKMDIEDHVSDAEEMADV